MNNQQDIVSKFDFIEYGESNIDAIYRHNFALYKYYHSDKKLVEPDKLIVDKGIIQNIMPIASNSFDGFSIQEDDFRQAELALLNKVNVEELNYGQRIKFRYYKEYVEFKIRYPEWYHIKDRNGFYALRRSELDKYKEGIHSFYFKDVYNFMNDDGTRNQQYFTNRTNDWKRQRDELLNEIESLKPRLRLLLIYNSVLARFMERVVKFFSIVDKYDGSELAYINSFNMERFHLTETLEVLGDYSQNINHNINTGHYKIALEIQHYCILMFDDMIGVLDNSFFIKIERTPLKEKFDEALNRLKNAIDLEKLDFLLRVGAVSIEPKSNDTDFNFKGSIFNDAVGQKLFSEFHKYYFDKKASPSNYSYLYYALVNDGYIDVSQEEYIKFCNQNEIKIKIIDKKKQLVNVREDESVALFYNKTKNDVLNRAGTK
jgi:hypothetical protein